MKWVSCQDPSRVPCSRDSTFSGEGEGCSPIAVLLNQPAFFALGCEVVETVGRQHRPIKCLFHWNALSQRALSMSNLRNLIFRTYPTQKSLPTKAQGNPDAPDRIGILSGKISTRLATTRTHAPSLTSFAFKSLRYADLAVLIPFSSQNKSALRHANHGAATRYSSVRLFKLQSRLDELLIRRSRSF